jgi:hypothetical protein
MFFKKINTVSFYVSATLLALLPFHAFLWTWFHSFFWTDNWTIFVQAWKEILVGILCLLAVAKFFITRKLPQQKSFWLGFSFVILAIAYAFFGNDELIQKFLGLRTAILFLVIFLAIQFFSFSSERIEQLKKIVLFMSGVVILFALLQKFILPADFLKYFGYSENISSWIPDGNLPMYHAVGQNGAMRLQSTFAGPNQLGAYLVMILPLAVATFWKRRKCIGCKSFLSFIIFGGLLTLFFTYSRSAWLGALGIILVFAIFQWRKNLSGKLKKRLIFGSVLGAVAFVIFGFLNSNFQEIITREASTSAHLERSLVAVQMVFENPFGLGLGKSAGVSQRFGVDITPENTYLGVALELGWLGGILFFAFIISLLFELRQKNSELFYSLLGVAIIAFFLHPLEDMPLALSLFLLIGSLNQFKA